MEKLDDVTVSILKAANIDESLLSTLSRDDLRDLLLGPEHFRRRKQLWSLFNPEQDHTVSAKQASIIPQTTASPNTTPLKTLQLPCPPEYVVYTDTELEQCRKNYCDMASTGTEECIMYKELRCRLVRKTITSMVSLLRASPGQMVQYPSKTDVTAMAKRIVEYYSMLQDKDDCTKYGSINAYLLKRLQNIKSPVKKQDPTPERGRPKKRRIDFLSDKELNEEKADYDADADSSGTSTSGASTILLSPASNSDDDFNSNSLEEDSLLIQVRHYKTLQEMYRKPKPNQDAVSQLLDLEFQARRAYIDSNATREENRAAQILEAYPCFKELHNVLGELRRILDSSNDKFLDQVRQRWGEFCSRIHFYGVSKKAMKPPMMMEQSATSTLSLFSASAPKNGVCQ
ncbi:uncharacterized protein [Eucyclogobius newberryi]|uniref:uncharacterized protein n=1 Tax=Eucyclogobius newberryi TaxID=166745 RepID=UPI003B594A8F